MKLNLKDKIQSKAIEDLTLGIMRKYIEERKKRFNDMFADPKTDKDDFEFIVDNLVVMDCMLDEISNYGKNKSSE